MAEVKILMHGLGDERRVVDTIYTQGHDEQAVKSVMKKVGMDPDQGWRSGYFYSARINPRITVEDALTLEDFEKYITRT